MVLRAQSTTEDYIRAERERERERERETETETEREREKTYLDRTKHVFLTAAYTVERSGHFKLYCHGY